MTNCITCGIEHTRCAGNSKTKPAKYCSVKCNKRASYYKKNPNKRSYGRSRKFWNTETGKGFKWEQYLAKKIGGTHHEFDSVTGIDVEGNDGNYDVKVCELYNRKSKKRGAQWVFNRNRKKDIISYYYCICLKDGEVVKELKIPSADFGNIGITVGKVSRYDVFKV